MKVQKMFCFPALYFFIFDKVKISHKYLALSQVSFTHLYLDMHALTHVSKCELTQTLLVNTCTHTHPYSSVECPSQLCSPSWSILRDIYSHLCQT